MVEPHPIAGPGRQVSEKTLELNVCAELLQQIRARPDCERALWLGLTQRQERHAGLDELIENVGPGHALMLQFKAPWPTSTVDYLYKFTINERQHEALFQLAEDHPQSVSYVFPLYSLWDKAAEHAPDLAQDTWLARAASIPFDDLIAPPRPLSGRHTVELIRDPGGVTAIVHSPQVIPDVINAQEYFGGRSFTGSSDLLRPGVPHTALREWIRSWDAEQSDGPQRSERSPKPPRFRGLNALYIPTDT